MSALHPVILFYKYLELVEPEIFAAEQRALCASLGLKGRVLIAAEGINGTLAGEAGAIGQYLAALRVDARFADLEVKTTDGDATTFPKLVVKVRREIVTLNAGIPLTAEQGNHLSPAEWKARIEQDAEVVLLDVRNRYESDAGKFENAVACEIENFRELPGFVDQLGDLKEKTILMYCTGGIRCEKASALLRSKGFESVYQLHGGILSYQEQFGNEHWLGECFVFDQRMTVKVDDGLVPIGKCAHTGQTTSRFVNCLHDPCHRLFLLAVEAEAEDAELRLCRECRAAGLTSATADYKRAAITSPASPSTPPDLSSSARPAPAPRRRGIRSAARSDRAR